MHIHRERISEYITGIHKSVRACTYIEESGYIHREVIY